MAIVHDSTIAAAVSFGFGLSYSHTTTGADRLLIVGVTVSSELVTSVTYALVEMDVVAETDAEGGHRGWMRRLVAPVTGANEVSVTIEGVTNITSYASSYTGVDQTTPVDTPATAVNTAGSTTPSVNVSSAAGDLVIDCVHDTADGTMTVDASQAERANHRGDGNGVGVGGSTEAGAATVTMSWTKGTSGKWGIIGVSINPVAPPPPSVVPLRTLMGIGLSILFVLCF